MKIRNQIQEIIFQEDSIIQIHGFYIVINQKIISFDIIMIFDIDYKKGLTILNYKKIFQIAYFSIIPDIDISD